MDAEVTMRIQGTFPDNLQVGDELHVDGVVTVHTIKAELTDVTGYHPRGAKTWLPVTKEVEVYANEMRFAATREP